MRKFLLLPLISSCLFLTGFGQTYTPILGTTGGYNQDVIAETPTAFAHTSVALDGSDYVLYSVDYGNTFPTGSGLPNNGTIVSGTRTYKLQPFAQNNAVLLMTGQSDSLELTTPASYASLSLFGFATEGPAQMLVVVKFTDGSGTVYSNLQLADWFDGTNAILSGFDRAGRMGDTPDYSSFAPNFYAIDLVLNCADQQKLVEEVLMINTTASPSIRTVIFGISGAARMQANITASVNPSCNGENNGTATVLGTGGQPPYQYNWSTTPVQHSGTAHNLVAGTYYCVVLDNNGCSDTTGTVTLTQPAALQSSESITICQGESYDIGDESYTDAGTYTTVLTAANGCDSTVTTVLTVSPVNVVVNASGLTLTAAGAGLQYQWLVCESNNTYTEIPGATGQSYTATAAGSYAVMVTQNGCSDVSACMVISSVGIEEQAAIAFSVYPNPALSTVSLQCEELVTAVRLYDLSGKAFEVPFDGSEITIQSLQAGVYLVRATTQSGRTVVARIVKQ